MTLLRQLARNVSGCVTDLKAGGQPLGLPWRGRLAGRPHRMRAQVVPDQDDPPPRGTGRPTPTAASRPRRLSWRFPARSAPCARARRRTLPDWPPHGRHNAGVYTDRLKRPLGAVSGHLCTLLHRCGQPWVCRSVHRLAKMASRRWFGAFVYTIAMRFAKAATNTNPRRALLHSNY